jgi:hypothetical protein
MAKTPPPDLKKENNGHDSGHIRVTWTLCPNRNCNSHEFEIWDVDFKADRFWCGTCIIELMPPCFFKLKIPE